MTKLLTLLDFLWETLQIEFDEFFILCRDFNNLHNWNRVSLVLGLKRNIQMKKKKTAVYNIFYVDIMNILL